jgi:hypothetical protein
MKLTFIVFCFILFLSISYAQRKDKIPLPLIGWDSLKTRIHYNDLFCRADIEGAFRVRIILDDSGNQRTVKVKYLNNFQSEISKADSFLVKAILQAFDGVKWSAGGFEFSVPVVFITRSSKSFHRQPFIMNSGDAIIIKGSYDLVE